MKTIFERNDMKILLVMSILLVLMIAGCAGQETAEPKQNYSVEVRGVKLTINMDMEQALDDLGEPVSTFTAPVCAFDGEDILYTYEHAKLDVFWTDKGAKLYSVDFMDDMISTEEGVCIGDDAWKVIEIYGEGTTAPGERAYSGDGMRLTFILRDGYVASVRYESTVLENELLDGVNVSRSESEPFHTDLSHNDQVLLAEQTDVEEPETATEARKIDNTFEGVEVTAYQENNIQNAPEETDDIWRPLTDVYDGQEEFGEELDVHIWDREGLNEREQLLNSLVLNPQKPDSAELSVLLDDLMPQIVDGCNSTSEKVRSIYEYLINNCSYSTTEKYDYEKDAHLLLTTGRGSCTYYVAAMHYMLNYIGVENRIVNGYRYPFEDRGRKSFHRWVEINLGGSPYILDSQWEDVLASQGGSGFERYLRTHEEMRDCYVF